MENQQEKIENFPAESDNENSTSFGKFKSADELLKAYNALQSEFTKRSQKLAEYEKNATTDIWEGKVAEFVKKYPVAERYAEELAEEIAKSADKSEENVLENALLNVLCGKVRTEEEMASDKSVVDRVLSEQNNREKVINGYLEGIRRNPSPVTLPKGGAIPATPPVRAKTIREAGEIAKKLIESQN